MVKELTTIEELDAYLRLMDEWTYSEVATNLYLLLRQWAGDPWRHGVDVNAIDIHTREPLNVGRHRALYDRRWVFDEKVDTDTWHETMVRVLASLDDNRTEEMTYRLLDDEPGVVEWLRHFTVNTRRRRWRRNKEYPVGSPEGYVDTKDDSEKTKEVPPPKGFRVPPTHSWRRELLAHDPWGGLDLEIDVKRALATLPRVDCALFIRHHADGATIQSLADGIPLGTVKRKLTASMRKVRDFLNETPPKRRGRPPKNKIINVHPIRSFYGLINCILTTPRGVADALSHQHNGAGPAACAARRPETTEEKKTWPGWSMREALSPEAEPWDHWRQKVLTWRGEGTHKQKLFWRSLRYGTIRDWTRRRNMAAFF